MPVAYTYRTANYNALAPARSRVLPIRASRAQHTNEVVHGTRRCPVAPADSIYSLRVLLMFDCVDRFCVLKTQAAAKELRWARRSLVRIGPMRALWASLVRWALRDWRRSPM